MRIILVPLLFFALSSQAQYVFPSYADSVSWRVRECVWGKCSTEVYKYKYDTVFCNNTYSVVDFEDGVGIYPIYIRSSASKVFVRHNIRWSNTNLNCNDPEQIAYDFSLLKGDTTYIDLGIKKTVIVDSIDYVVINGIKRKRLHVYEYNNGSYYYFNRYWIQGFGTPTHPLYFIDPLEIGSELDWKTLCMDSNDIVLYGSHNYPCDAFLEVDEHFLIDALEIYPNPHKGKLTIQFKEQIEEVEVEIRNILGEVVVRKESSYTSSLKLEFEGSSGLYFVSVKSKGKLIGTGKVVRR